MCGPPNREFIVEGNITAGLHITICFMGFETVWILGLRIGTGGWLLGTQTFLIHAFWGNFLKS
jgi:hypothetical protein